MKSINFIKNSLLLLFILISPSVLAQTAKDPDNAPFIGTWQFQYDNSIFKITIWEDEERGYDNNYCLHGNYEKVAIIRKRRSVLYTSKTCMSPAKKKSHSAFDGYVFAQNDGTKLLYGNFKECHDGGSGIDGNFTIIQLPSCATCPKKISWSLSKADGVQIIHNPALTDFVVPKDIVLTKIE